MGQPVFTHGDLSSLNILVRRDDILGLVDWETAGWYPPYWEYTSACQVNLRNTFWARYIGSFLEPWPEALKMEKTRQQWWGVI
jgi:aminoglycoside phosphotransferase (APT) family kinase protein